MGHVRSEEEARRLQGCDVSNYRTEPQLYQTGRTGGQEPVGGECVSIAYLRHVHFEVIKV